MSTQAPEQHDVARTLKKRERGRHWRDRAFHLIDFAFTLLYVLLGLRLLMGLVAANHEAGFARFVALITQPFYGPFVDILPSPATGWGTLELPVVFCIGVYLLLHLAVRRLLDVLLGARRPGW